MAPRKHHRYLLVMRHAQRQDEVDDGWAAAAAARPGGRPWDPPLSSPHGLAQAEEAAEKLVAWERDTGARIVAVVASPFLRCLQTAAAACRRLGLQQLHVNWAFSETLCRISNAPTGPLSSWMWPRVPVTPPQQRTDTASHGSTSTTTTTIPSTTGPTAATTSAATTGTMSAEEVLREIGAVVVAAAGSAVVSSPERAAPGWDGAVQVQHEGEGGAEAQDAEGADTATAESRDHPLVNASGGQVLKGLYVSVLPTTLDPAAIAAALDTGGSGGFVGGRLGCSNGLASCSHQAVENVEDEDPAEWMCSMNPSETIRPDNSAPSHDAVGGEEVALAPHDGSLEGPQQTDRWTARQQHEVYMYNDHYPAAPSAYSMPYSPETIETAHARYRAVLQCLMATSVATPQTQTSTSMAAGDTVVCSHAGMKAPDLGPNPTGLAKVNLETSISGKLQSLKAWQSVWQKGAARSARGQQGADAAGCVSGTCQSKGVQCNATFSDEPIGDEAAIEQHPSRLPTSQLSSPLHDNTTLAGQGESRHRQQLMQRIPWQQTAKAVLVVTHGEAVACSASTVDPCALVYEVRHTGFVVLSSVRNEAGFREQCFDGHGGGSIEDEDVEVERLSEAWELVPDHHGDRGVLWMSALEDSQ